MVIITPCFRRNERTLSSSSPAAIAVSQPVGSAPCRASLSTFVHYVLLRGHGTTYRHRTRRSDERFSRSAFVCSLSLLDDLTGARWRVCRRCLTARRLSTRRDLIAAAAAVAINCVAIGDVSHRHADDRVESREWPIIIVQHAFWLWVILFYDVGIFVVFAD